MVRMAEETSLLCQLCRTRDSRYSVLFFLEQLGLDANAPERVGREEEAAGKESGGEGASRADPSDVLIPVTADEPRGRGDTPLHAAVEAGHLSLVITLLTKGADPKAVSAVTGRTPLDLAVDARRSATARFLRVDRKVFFVPLRFSFPPVVASVMEALVRHVGLRVVDVESAALWGTTAQAMGIHALLTYATTTPKPRVEVLLTQMDGGLSGASLYRLSDLAAIRGCTGFVTFLLFPQLVMLLSTWLFSGFFANALVALLIVALFVQVKRLDEKVVGCRSLRSLGFFLGMLGMEALCLPLYTTLTYYSYHVFDEEPHKALTLWLIPSAVLSAVLGLYVFFVSPGTVSSTVGYRKAIYTSIAHARASMTAVVNPNGGPAGGGGFSKELVYSTDLATMVKKPLRAQRCRQTNRVILRYDHYCAYLASPIGALNHRAFIGFLLSLFSLFSSFYYYAHWYHRMLSGASSQYKRRMLESYFSDDQRKSMKSMENLLFSTSSYRYGYMYTQVFLPIILLALALELFAQLFAISRGITLFDMDHVGTESSLYCFLLGERMYSLFDKGFKGNLQAFFLFREALAAVQYRVPQMNAHLKKIVEEHQRWQVSGGCGCEHNHGGVHSSAARHPNPHNGGAPPEGQQHAPPPAADPAAADDREEERKGGEGGTHRPPQRDAAAAQTDADGNGAARPASAFGAADGSSAVSLAQSIFQEMVRSGTDDIALSRGNGLSEEGTAGQTQREWEQAVEQAKTMFAFFRRTMANGPEAYAD